ncbi:hypothetical protein HMPREF9153_2277 [Cutibacterium avidum ATCC 25577]|uniref:Uncharacterized protein n=1 Tax=Cutibacterium avidum ATCC 25577 TaxID=997355 RepID=G4CYS6_9ACTN|nr:hypothetical protein HMPREF9153_2277 [Cutibacterium avidum ATCC 25577]
MHDLHCTEPSGTRLSTTSMPVPQGLGSCPQQRSWSPPRPGPSTGTRPSPTHWNRS